MIYTVVLVAEREGGYWVHVPALQGCHTQGETIPEALFMAYEAIQLNLEVLEEDGDPFPTDVCQVTVDMSEASEAFVYKLAVPFAPTGDGTLKPGTLRGIIEDA
jgi:predicted RNase H-like HicB family nuclease